MASQRLKFFATPIEFLEILNKIISSLNLHAALAEGIKDARVQVLPLPLNHKQNISDLFLTDKAIKNGIPVSEVNFPKEGWIQIIPPKEKDAMLLYGWVAIKTDWHEENNKYENKDSIILFNKISRMIKKYLKYPVLGYDVLSGDSQPYKIGYTEGAEKFEKDGGLLLQWGDDGFYSTRFAIDKNYIRTDPDLPIKRAKKRAKRATE